MFLNFIFTHYIDSIPAVGIWMLCLAGAAIVFGLGIGLWTLRSEDERRRKKENTEKEE